MKSFIDYHLQSCVFIFILPLNKNLGSLSTCGSKYLNGLEPAFLFLSNSRLIYSKGT